MIVRYHSSAEVKFLNVFFSGKAFILIGFIICSLLSPSALFAAVNAQNGNAETFFVSKNGNNQGGRSWESAWNELDQIQWALIGPGDTIRIDGGATEMIYRTPLAIGSSGASGQPIQIQKATGNGRNGKIILFGGRTTLLPYCGQPDYQNTTDGVAEYGIRTNDHKWLTIDGIGWQGMVIRGFGNSGIRIDKNSDSVTIRNVEIFDNGYATKTSNGWDPDGFGIRVGGRNVLVERAIIYDNGQDAIQSLGEDNNLYNLRISQSWLHNARKHPSVDESANYCAHADGLQIFAGGLVQQVTIEDSVIGPGLTNAIILGQTTTSTGLKADVQNVTLRNSLVTKAADNGIFGYEGSNTRNWTIDAVTVHCSNTKWHCITLDNPQHQVQNSIFVGAKLTFPDGLNSMNNNCTWQTDGFTLGTVANPQFANVANGNSFSLDDYSLLASSTCVGKGSRVTSVQKLVGFQPSLFSDMGNTSPVTPPPATPPLTTPLPPTAPPNTPPNTATSILLKAANGEIFAPYVAEAGVIYQPVDVKAPIEGGLVRYRFDVTTAGVYQIRAIVNAETEGQNSVFLNVNGDPTGDYMVWDIPLTSGYQERVVSWRGNGTPEANEFATKVFYLETGNHTLFVRGREAYTYIRQFQFELTEAASPTPGNQPPFVATERVYLPFSVSR